MAGSGINLFGDWKTAIKLMTTARARFIPAASKTLQREGVRAQGLMRKNIGKASPPQRPSTTATGGGGKPLIRSEPGLRGSINVVTQGTSGLRVFIGVPRSDGKFMLATIHEEGRVIVQPLTEKMRAFLIIKLRAIGAPAKGGGLTRVLVTQIPARPFIEPAIEEVRSGFKVRFTKSFARALKGDYGKL